MQEPFFFSVHPKACIVCLTPIEKSRRRVRYFCSTACTRAKHQIQAPRPRVVRTCGQCGNDLETTVDTAKYCSRRCKGSAAYDRRHRQWRLYDEPAGPPEPLRYETPAGPPEPVRCDGCREWRTPGRSSFCSQRCHEVFSEAGRNRACSVWFGDCADCGRSFTSRQPTATFCSTACARRNAKRQRRYLKRAVAGGDPSVTLRAIAERDGWRCHICGGATNSRYQGGRDRDPTIDHLIPVSSGGSHTRENVALAHNKCNWERGAMGAAQLRLVG